MASIPCFSHPVSIIFLVQTCERLAGQTECIQGCCCLLLMCMHFWCLIMDLVTLSQTPQRVQNHRPARITCLKEDFVYAVGGCYFVQSAITPWPPLCSSKGCLPVLSLDGRQLTGGFSPVEQVLSNPKLPDSVFILVVHKTHTYSAMTNNSRKW